MRCSIYKVMERPFVLFLESCKDQGVRRPVKCDLDQDIPKGQLSEETVQRA